MKSNEGIKEITHNVLHYRNYSVYLLNPYTNQFD